MEDTWSGAIIYEWIEEVNNYGLVSYGPTVAPTASGSNVVAGYSVSGTPTPISPDFDNLSSQWATLTPSGVSSNAYTPSLSPPPCPPYTSGFWEVSANAPLPTIGASGTKYKAAATTSSSAPASSTSKSSGSSVMRTTHHATHTSLRKSNAESFLTKLKDFHKNQPALWWAIVAVISVGGIGFVA